MKSTPSPNHSRKLATLLVSGALQFLTIPALAQQPATPGAEPPPPISNEQPVVKPSTSSDVPSLTDASNATGKSTGSGTVKELRFPAVDADSDGLISRAEFTTFMDAGNVARSAGDTGSPTDLLFRTIDANSDNFLSEAEVNAYQKEQDKSGIAR